MEGGDVADRVGVLDGFAGGRVETGLGEEAADLDLAGAGPGTVLAGAALGFAREHGCSGAVQDQVAQVGKVRPGGRDRSGCGECGCVFGVDQHPGPGSVVAGGAGQGGDRCQIGTGHGRDQLEPFRVGHFGAGQGGRP